MTDEQIAGLDTLATELVEVWFADRPKRVGRWLISSRRFAEVLLAITTSKPNADRTMPFAMHRAAVQHLHAEGKFRHGWVHDVYTAVRDYLSSRGMLPAEDDGKYVPPVRDGSGAVLKTGQASRWKVAQWVRDYVNGFHKGGSIWPGRTSRYQADDVNRSAETFASAVQEIGTAVANDENKSPPLVHTLMT